MRSAVAVGGSFVILLALVGIAAYLLGWQPSHTLRFDRIRRLPDGMRRRYTSRSWRRQADSSAEPDVPPGPEIYHPGRPNGREPAPAVVGAGVRGGRGAVDTRAEGRQVTHVERAFGAPVTDEPSFAAPPQVRRLVVAGARHGRELEPRLPGRVVVGCQWHDSFFHGWCGPGAAGRPAVRLTVRGAALRGATHAGNGTEGQDAMGAAWDDRRQALYLAVADGLGSLRKSGPVAQAAIAAALQLCVTRPADTTFADSGPRLFSKIADGLRLTYEQTGEPLDGACTLVVAEVVPRFSGATVTVHGVGDSEAWLLHDDAWHPLHHERRAPEDGRDIPANATRELPGHVDPRTVEYTVPAGSVLLLGTDGFAGALDTTVSPLARGLAGYWRSAPSWLDFVNHVGFVDDYWSDDRTAVAVWIGAGHADG
jgi:serine/threonine protein phosphatase PrpC